MFEGGKTVKVEPTKPEIEEEKIVEKKLTPEEEEKQKEVKRIRDERSKDLMSVYMSANSGKVAFGLVLNFLSLIGDLLTPQFTGLIIQAIIE